MFGERNFKARIKAPLFHRGKYVNNDISTTKLLTLSSCCIQIYIKLGKNLLYAQTSAMFTIAII